MENENDVVSDELIFDEDLSNVFQTEESVVEAEAMDDEVAAATAQAEAAAVASIQGHEEIEDVDIQTLASEETIQTHEFMITTDGCFLPQPAENAPDVEVSLEDQLKSTEKLDRSSPDLWPTNLPTNAKQVLHNNQLKTGETDTAGSWAQGLDPEDINLLHQFGSLTSSSLVEEVKKLQNIAYQLGLEEQKEMTRGKLLHVFEESHTVLKESGQVKLLWK